MVVPVIAAGVVFPITGGLDRLSVPPSVKLPVEVTVPLSDIPETVPVPLTLVTEPEPLLLKVVQSAELKAPRLVADAVGTLSVITGVVVPFATVELRSVPVVPKVNAATLVTVPLPLLLKVVKSVADKYPSTLVVALAMLIAGVVPPLDTTGAVPDTLVTLLLKVVQSAEVNAPLFVPEAEGRLKVWVAVALLMLKSDPEVPVAKY